IDVPHDMSRAMAVGRDIGIPVVSFATRDLVSVRPLTVVGVSKEDLAPAVAESLPDQPDAAAGIALEARIQVGPGIVREPLNLAPTVAFIAHGVEVPIHVLGVTRRIVGLLCPDKPGFARAIHGDLRRPHISRNPRDRKDRAPRSVVVAGRMDFIVEPAVARPDCPDGAVGSRGDCGEVVFTAVGTEPVQAREPGDALAGLAEWRTYR